MSKRLIWVEGDDFTGWCCSHCPWGITAPHLESTVAALAFASWQDRVDAPFGPYSSGLTMSVAEVAHEQRKVLWNHGGFTDEIPHRGWQHTYARKRLFCATFPAGWQDRRLLSAHDLHRALHSRHFRPPT